VQFNGVGTFMHYRLACLSLLVCVGVAGSAGAADHPAGAGASQDPYPDMAQCLLHPSFAGLQEAVGMPMHLDPLTARTGGECITQYVGDVKIPAGDGTGGYSYSPTVEIFHEVGAHTVGLADAEIADASDILPGLGVTAVWDDNRRELLVRRKDSAVRVILWDQGSTSHYKGDDYQAIAIAVYKAIGGPEDA